MTDSPPPRPDSATRLVPRRHRRGAARWRTASLIALLLVGAVGAVSALAVRSGSAPTELSPEELAAPLVAGPADAAAGAGPTGTPTVTPVATATPTPVAPVLRLPGPVPTAGKGTFGYDSRPGELLGRGGGVKRYRVAVETDSGEEVEAFGTAVQDALADPQSWIGSGRLRLQRVPGSARHDFTVYLATPQTAGRMCAAGGVNIRVGGRPYTSCRAPGKVIINLERWRLSVPHFVSARVPLELYRDYVVNHEVGHELGHRHERCPGTGRPAPVMMQQTLFLRGCVANPWPYRDGRRYAGPAL